MDGVRLRESIRAKEWEGTTKQCSKVVDGQKQAACGKHVNPSP